VRKFEKNTKQYKVLNMNVSFKNIARHICEIDVYDLIAHVISMFAALYQAGESTQK
jgi:hypothetical protein